MVLQLLTVPFWYYIWCTNSDWTSSKTVLIDLKLTICSKCWNIPWLWKIWCCSWHNSKLLRLWITLPVMQVFSGRVLHGPVPDPCLRLIQYPIPDIQPEFVFSYTQSPLTQTSWYGLFLPLLDTYHCLDSWKLLHNRASLMCPSIMRGQPNVSIPSRKTQLQTYKNLIYLFTKILN